MGIVERSAGRLKSLFLGVQDGGARIPFADNVKGLAIVLVVAGHWLSHYTNLEGGVLHGASVLYGVIYCIHMPAFALVTGYLAKGDGCTAKGIRTTAWLISVYLAASSLHSLIYALFYAEQGVPVGLQHLTEWLSGYPPYSLWWLISLAIWRTVLPLVQHVKRAFRSWGPLLIASLLLVVFCEFSLDDGPWMSMMRTVYFWPFFLIGHVVRDCEARSVPADFLKKGRLLCTAVFALLVMLVASNLYGYTVDEIYELSKMFLYGSYPVWIFEKDLNFTVDNLLFFYAAAIALSLLLVVIMPKRVCFLTSVGRYSLNVYLVHVMALLVISSPLVAQTNWGSTLTGFVPLTFIGIALVIVCSKGAFAKRLDAVLRKLKCKEPM